MVEKKIKLDDCRFDAQKWTCPKCHFLNLHYLVNTPVHLTRLYCSYCGRYFEEFAKNGD